MRASAKRMRAGRTGMLDQTWVWHFWSSRLVHRALLVSIPNGIFAALLCQYIERSGRDDVGFSVLGVSQVWSGYNFVLGFLVVFRTQHAYARFWEGATLLQEVRGEWFNAISSLVAFCAGSAEKRREVEEFQNLVVRLTSMLHCAALEQVSVGQVKDFATLDTDSIDPEALRYLRLKSDKCEVILQWIQRLIVEAQTSGVLPIAPPILSRVFQELSRGIVNMNSARKITDIPFPRPYAHLIRLMLAIQWVVTPIVCSMLLQNMFVSGGLSMITVFAFTSTVHIAAEIENPFGDDPNDLPLGDFQHSFNLSLLTLLERRTQQPPKYVHKSIVGHSFSVDLQWLAPSPEADAQARPKPSRRGSAPESSIKQKLGSEIGVLTSHGDGVRNSAPAGASTFAEREAKLDTIVELTPASVARREEKHEAKSDTAGSSGSPRGALPIPTTPPDTARRWDSPTRAPSGPPRRPDEPGDLATSAAARCGVDPAFLVEIGDTPPRSAASFGVKVVSPPGSPAITNGR